MQRKNLTITHMPITLLYTTSRFEFMGDNIRPCPSLSTYCHCYIMWCMQFEFTLSFLNISPFKKY
uniref:Predicted protein n=1 Tax=Hordeum vulgare subsp. vulgare TaxID=112509 RepID=F2CTM4_HORVV|nr:predicted protein [Hordeum vulgare subsp. vulgare]